MSIKNEQDINRILEKYKKKYQESLNELNILEMYLMEKDKKELVGIIIGLIISGKINE